MQFKGGISQDVAQSGLAQRRAEAADDDVHVAGGGAKNEAADHDVLARPDKAAGADVGQGGVGHRTVVVVKFHQSHAGRLVLAGENGGISRRRERGHDDRFPVVAGLERRAFNLRTLAVPPIVIRGEQPRRAVEPKDRVSKTSPKPKLPSDGPIPRKTTFFGAAPVMMNPPIITLSPVSTLSRVEILRARPG